MTVAGESQWQSPSDDLQDRRRMLLCIRKLMRLMMTRPEMVYKIPVMSKKMEHLLYRSARTKREYLDRSTLKARIRCVAQTLEKVRC